MQVFSIVKLLTDRVIQEFGCMPSEGKYKFIVTRHDIDGNMIELKKSSFSFIVNGKEFTPRHMSHEFVVDMQLLFTNLRDEMQISSPLKSKWDEASLIFDKSKKINMDYKYPPETNN